MADEQEQVKGRAAPQSKETVVEKGRASAAPGEIDPSADQGDRQAVAAAQLAVAPVKTLGMKKAEEAKKPAKTEGLSPREAAIAAGERSYVDESGKTRYIDPDEFDKPQVQENIPTDVCLNCKHHGVESVLNDNGFCEECGFKLSRLSNMQLEPAPRSLSS